MFVSVELRKRASRLDVLARGMRDGTATAADAVAELLSHNGSESARSLPQTAAEELIKFCAGTADSLRRLADSLERQQVPGTNAERIRNSSIPPQLTPTEIRIINYARLASAALQSRVAVFATWLLPAFIQLCGWLVLFRPSPTDGPLVQLRNCVGSLAGLPLLAGALLGLVRPSGINIGLVAIVTWSTLIGFAMFSPARRLPLWAHFGLSIFWTLGGLLAWLTLAA